MDSKTKIFIGVGVVFLIIMIIGFAYLNHKQNAALEGQGKGNSALSELGTLVLGLKSLSANDATKVEEKKA